MNTKEGQEELDSRYIISTYPKDNEHNIPVNIHPKISFDKEVDSNSINIDTIFLLDKANKLVDFTGYIGKDKIICIIPTSELRNNEKYSIKFGIGISLLNGDYLNLTDYSVEFTTEME